MQIETIRSERHLVEMTMPVLPEYLQPFGYLHGGVTIALLETAASMGALNSTNLEKERPFGISVQIRHRKSCKNGMLQGVATLDRREGDKQFWHVVASDDKGDVVSDGEIICKIVSLERLEEKINKDRK